MKQVMKYHSESGTMIKIQTENMKKKLLLSIIFVGQSSSCFLRQTQSSM